VDGGATGKKVLAGLPVVSIPEAGSMLEKSEISAVYILPDCPDEHQDFVLRLCERCDVPIHLFQFSVDQLLTPARLLPLERPATDTSVAATLATVAHPAQSQ